MVQYALKNHQICQKSGQKWENPRWNSYVGHWNSNVGIPMSNIGIPTLVFQVQPRNSKAREPTNVTSDSVVQDDETCTWWLWINHRKIQRGAWVCLLPLLDPILTYGGVGWILPWLCSFALAYSLIPIQKAKLIWTNLLGHIYHAMKFSTYTYVV